MRHFVRIQMELPEVKSGWSASLLWFLRGVLLLTILAEVGAGNTLSAAEALLALALCSLSVTLLDPAAKPSRVDLEVILLLIAVGNCTLGVAANLYRSLPYYDKFLHVVNPLALAFYGLLLLGNNLDTGSRNIAPVALAALTFLAIVGASAVWELLEYASDQLFNSTTQGSPTMAPLDDTMWDLLLSTLGAFLGAVYSAVKRLPSLTIPHTFGGSNPPARSR